MSKKLLVLVLSLVLVTSAALGVASYIAQHPQPFTGDAEELLAGIEDVLGGEGTLRLQASEIDLAKPDALIRTASLSRLPPDLLRIPLAKSVLTEDFVDYYEHNEARLSLSGTLRRMAYEHKLDWPEQLLEGALDAPAELALWRDEGGRLKYFAVTMTRNTLARAIGMALPMLPDTQLRALGKLRGTKTPLLLLDYGKGHRLLLLIEGDRLVALSHPGMLFMTGAGEEEALENAPAEAGEDESAATEEEEDGTEVPGVRQSRRAAQVLAQLLQDKAEASPFARHFQLSGATPEKKHELSLGAAVFTLGYDYFAPGISALRLQFDDQGVWQSAALIDDAHWPKEGLASAALWSVMPHGASFCAVLPVNWPRFEPIVDSISLGLAEQTLQPADLLAYFAPAGAVCWYADERLYQPLFVAPLAKPFPGEVSEQLFLLTSLTYGNMNSAGLKGDYSSESHMGLWQGEIPSRFGEKTPDNEERLLHPAVGITGTALFFSPQKRLVDKAMSVANKRFPALADSLLKSPAGAEKQGEETLLFIDPSRLAKLLQKEMYAALPRDDEPMFRNAADAYLAPRLEALGNYPVTGVRLQKAGEKGNWRTLDWEVVAQSAGKRR
ncbi:MAG: DUF2138 family protein [Zoogloeaceae bacterium]|nr:DUF2138 family protein [Zoogloeaceae bacterium]